MKKCFEYDDKIKATLARTKEMMDTVSGIKHYVDRSTKLTPFLTNMQISDYLQEFFCAPDQLKMIKFENQRMRKYD